MPADSIHNRMYQVVSGMITSMDDFICHGVIQSMEYYSNGIVFIQAKRGEIIKGIFADINNIQVA